MNARLFALRVLFAVSLLVVWADSFSCFDPARFSLGIGVVASWVVWGAYLHARSHLPDRYASTRCAPASPIGTPPADYEGEWT